MRQGPTVKLMWGIGVLASAVWACETTRNPGGIQRDLTPPVITLTNPTNDTQPIASGLRFGIDAADNLALRSIRLIFSGGHIDTTDTVFTGTTRSVSISELVTFPAGSGAGGNVDILARVTDGAGNSAEATLTIFLSNVAALIVTLNTPSPGAVASATKGIPIKVTAVQNSGIRRIGFIVVDPAAVSNPTVPPPDSVTFPGPIFSDSVVYTDTVIVQATTGTFLVEGFAEDSAGRRGTSSRVTVTIQSVVNDATPPVVSHTIGARVEVNDSITVRATDPSAIAWIGFEVRDPGPDTVLNFDSLDVSLGNLTDVTHTFSLDLGGIIQPPFPKSVVVRGYACDAANLRNCAFSSTSTVIGSPSLSSGGALFTPAAIAQTGVDTVIIVAGITKPLPFGGSIADAIFNANDSTLYLTNPVLSRVEIFQVEDTAFVPAGIPTAGPQPWGIALWPHDTLGNYDDTIVVANSGGTQLSIIDVRPTVRRLVWRHDLPNFLIETYHILTNPTREVIEVFDVSDRPQYVATVCRAGSTPPLCDQDSIFAIYSTTPTVSSTSPFSRRATLRMEKLINTQDTTQLFGHLFWEIAGDQTLAVPGQDTLRIEIRRGRPYNQQKVILSACLGVMIDISRFGLGDLTFVRNSGNFTHAFVGEGGNITTPFARVMGYTTKAPLLQGAAAPPTGTFLSCTPALGITEAGENQRDLGMSPAIDVSDFISNTGVRVAAIATNFNGGTNLVRADSIYYLDEGLRLKGTSVAPTGAPGLDMNYNHSFLAGTPGTPTFGGTLSPNDRLAFAGRPDANIDVFDTFFYGRVGSIPVRDPIIGPLRVARNAANTRQWLFGVTARGLVMVELPIITNPNPQVLGPTIP